MSSIVTSEHIAFYEKNGFVQIDHILLPAELAELTAAMEEAMSERSDFAVAKDEGKGAYYRVLNQKVNVWRDHGIMAKYSLHARIAEAAKELSGASGIRLFHDHALWKMPQDSKPTPWHQDLPYWPMNEPGALSAWIPLDDVDEQNGCMMFVPGSHQAGTLAGIDLVNPQNIFDYVKGTEHERVQPVVVPLQKGSCTFHNGRTFHYAHANLSNKPRRVLAIIYMPDGTTFSGKKHLVTDGRGLLVDEPIKGGTFPLLA